MNDVNNLIKFKVPYTFSPTYMYIVKMTTKNDNYLFKYFITIKNFKKLQEHIDRLDDKLINVEVVKIYLVDEKKDRYAKYNS